MSRRGRAVPVVGDVNRAAGPDRDAGRLEQTGHRQPRDGVAVVADPDQGAGDGGRGQQNSRTLIVTGIKYAP
jgi:hypothetical protein